jgi:SAM-dependent methyltransferase
MLRKIKQFLSSTPESEQMNETVTESTTMELTSLETLIESQSFAPDADNTTDIVEDYDIETDISDPDEGYIMHSTEVVGYDNRERQFANYSIISDIVRDASILDFGCGRGDFKVFHAQHQGIELDQIDYTGIDINNVLIDAGKELYPGIDLQAVDWMNTPTDLKKEWSININSLNIRYDKDISKTDWEYFKASVTSMYAQATSGIVAMLSSDTIGTEDGLINWNAGDIINWAQKEFGGAAIDHSFSDEMFTLIIYK